MPVEERINLIHQEDRHDKYKDIHDRRIATINSFKSFVGIGILSLPFAFKEAGWLYAIVGTAFIGWFSYYCSYLIVKVKTSFVKKGIFSESETVTYSQVAEKALPEFHLGAIVGITGIWTCQIGCMIGYLVFIGLTLNNVFPGISYESWILILSPFCIAMSFIKQMDNLLLNSVFGSLSLVIGLIFSFISIVQSTTKDNDDHIMFDTAQMYPVNAWHDVSIFLGISIFAMEGINNVLPVHEAMSTKTRSQYPLALRDVYIFLVGLYIFIGILFWWLLGNQITSTITIILPKNIFGGLARIAFSLYILVSFPFAVFPCSEETELWVIRIIEILCFKNEINDKKPMSISSGSGGYRYLIYYIVRTFLVTVTVLIAILVKDLGNWLSLIGYLGFSIQGFIAPCLMNIRTTKLTEALNSSKSDVIDVYLSLFGVVFGSLVCVVGTVECISNIISGNISDI